MFNTKRAGIAFSLVVAFALGYWVSTDSRVRAHGESKGKEIQIDQVHFVYGLAVGGAIGITNYSNMNLPANYEWSHMDTCNYVDSFLENSLIKPTAKFQDTLIKEKLRIFIEDTLKNTINTDCTTLYPNWVP